MLVIFVLSVLDSFWRMPILGYVHDMIWGVTLIRTHANTYTDDLYKSGYDIVNRSGEKKWNCISVL